MHWRSECRMQCKFNRLNKCVWPIWVNCFYI